MQEAESAGLDEAVRNELKPKIKQKIGQVMAALVDQASAADTGDDKARSEHEARANKLAREAARLATQATGKKVTPEQILAAAARATILGH